MKITGDINLETVACIANPVKSLKLLSAQPEGADGPPLRKVKGGLEDYRPPINLRHLRNSMQDLKLSLLKKRGRRLAGISASFRILVC